MMVVAVIAAIATPTSARTLRQVGSATHSGSVNPGGPGQVLWGYYETTEPPTFPGPENSPGHAGHGDNILTLINPNGGSNPPSLENFACAMIYVFDDDEEMGECCGCPISSAGMDRFSVESELTSNWAPLGNEGSDNQSGAIAVIATMRNRIPENLLDSDSNGCANSIPGTDHGACNGGCDPGATPGYALCTVNLLGSIIHNQGVATGPDTLELRFGLTEVGMFDDAGGDSQNLSYLEQQCSFLADGSSGGGVCHCPEDLEAAAL
jgi:hypothetical protein